MGLVKGRTVPPSSGVKSAAGQGVVVTGASTGIGFHAACHLASKGFRVFGTVRRKQDGNELEQSGVIPILLDVTDEESVTSASARVTQQLQGAPLLGLVNNAGIALPGPMELLELEEFRQVFEVNLFGVVAVTKAFLPLLKESRGRIVNISSISVRLRPPFNSPYVSSKCALEAFSDCLRRELYPFGIEVVVIQPGIVKTPIWKKGASRDLSQALNTVYEAPLATMKEYAESLRAMPASRTSDAIHYAITTRRPPIRMPVVGKRFRHRLMRWLPERWKDRMVAKRVWGHLTSEKESR